MSRGLTCVWLLALIHLTALIIVTVVQQIQISDLGHSDAELYVLLIDLVNEQQGDAIPDVLPLTQEDKGEPETRDDVTEHANRKRQLFGYDVILADMLRAQEKVIESHCTNATKVCAQGPKGEKGVKGGPGPLGQKGVKGVPGPKGEVGPGGAQGLTGDTGPVGLQGLKGDTGVQGARGATGGKGARGPKGDTGPAGTPGTPGTKGEKGAKGATGPRGPQGPKGATGAQGQKGEPGVRGIKGETGDNGAPGDPGTKLGADCECLKPPKILDTVPAVTTVPLGSPVRVTCEATGNPQPEVKWDGRPNNQLVLDSTIVSDFHGYTCTATNPFGTDSKTMTLTRS